MSEGPYREGIEARGAVLVSTTNEIGGHVVTQYLGIVRGIVVRSPSLGQGLMGSFKALGGGNIAEFTRVCEAARHEAFEQMVEHAQALGADAIVGMRYDATEFMQGATEVLAYGTAVRLAPARD
ncbi:MAG: YbjQ family protein [Sandaracinus sp.]|nr:YbjQ family protein [Sandaracinus sp.]